MGIKHDIANIIQSSSSNCTQAATTQFLSFYGIEMTPEAVEQQVPVRKDSEGHPLGTFFADIGCWLMNAHDLAATMHVFDVQIIDRSWRDLPRRELEEELEKLLETGVDSAHTPYETILIDAYVGFLRGGGEIDIAKCTHQLLRGLLDKGPILAVVSLNYLYDHPRSRYDAQNRRYLPDATSGEPITHAVVLTGYDEGRYFYNDPDAELGGQHEVESDILIGAICTAQLNANNYILTVKQ